MTKIEEREAFYQLNKVRLAELAFKGLSKGLGNNGFIVVAIDVDDLPGLIWPRN